LLDRRQYGSTALFFFRERVAHGSS
jgi:hypothetical protein